MAGIDETRAFHPLRVAVLTVSDTRDAESDASGAYLAEAVRAAGHELVDRRIVADDVAAIRTVLTGWVEGGTIEIILTTGGTGFAPRDVTPEAVRPLLRREMDGFAILFHRASHETVGLSTLQSRALAGQVGDAFIFCLPGSPGACRDGWTRVIREALDSRYRPCSVAGNLPRLRAVLA